MKNSIQSYQNCCNDQRNGFERVIFIPRFEFQLPRVRHGKFEECGSAILPNITRLRWKSKLCRNIDDFKGLDRRKRDEESRFGNFNRGMTNFEKRQSYKAFGTLMHLQLFSILLLLGYTMDVTQLVTGNTSRQIRLSICIEYY